MVHCLFALLVVYSGALSADPGSDGPKAKGGTELEGSWRVVEIGRDGEALKGDDVTNMRLTFKGGALTIGGADGAGRPREKSFKLDPAQSPKQIEIISLDGRERGEVSACIYELDNGRLRLCMPYSPAKNPRERPTEFKTHPGDGLMLFTLERVEAK